VVEELGLDVGVEDVLGVAVNVVVVVKVDFEVIGPGVLVVAPFDEVDTTRVIPFDTNAVQKLSVQHPSTPFLDTHIFPASHHPVVQHFALPGMRVLPPQHL
jgi:hypothetical protein